MGEIQCGSSFVFKPLTILLEKTHNSTGQTATMAPNTPSEDKVLQSRNAMTSCVDKVCKNTGPQQKTKKKCKMTPEERREKNRKRMREKRAAMSSKEKIEEREKSRKAMAKGRAAMTSQKRLWNWKRTSKQFLSREMQ